MAQLTYRGFAYRQTEAPAAPWLVTFVASSEELLTWAGIPRKSEQNLTGFQRPMDDARVAKAKAFFDMPNNQSPTALIVGIPKPVPDQQPAIQLVMNEG